MELYMLGNPEEENWQIFRSRYSSFIYYLVSGTCNPICTKTIFNQLPSEPKACIEAPGVS